MVELLIAKGANFEHRNVSDYTPLSLAASGGYVGIIKLLLSHGAEINSRTGSKLGISPLMLASMNGHTAAVKLLLDMGSDINAQIETNRNTALTLACFQGRHEVVNLLVERKANIEHRAKVCRNRTSIGVLETWISTLVTLSFVATRSLVTCTRNFNNKKPTGEWKS